MLESAVMSETVLLLMLRYSSFVSPTRALMLCTAQPEMLRDVRSGSEPISSSVSLGSVQPRDVEGVKRGELTDDAQIKPVQVVHRERFETREARQVFQCGDALGQLQRFDRPQLVGHQLLAGELAELLAHIRVQHGVCQLDRLDDVADGVARVNDGADQPVLAHAQRGDGGLAAANWQQAACKGPVPATGTCRRW